MGLKDMGTIIVKMLITYINLSTFIICKNSPSIILDALFHAFYMFVKPLKDYYL